ncbi:MAG: SDR family NAD(P)-dependent oxidoreductase [Acidobacteriota bacterium]
MNALDDKTVLITGGARGLGRALAVEACARGARAVLADVDGEAAERAAEALRANGAQVEAVTLDVTDADAFERLAADVWTRHGGLDLLFNNAGVGVSGEVIDMTLDAWNRVLDVNLRGVVHGIQAVYPRMVRRGAGQIVNTACVAGLVPFPLTAAYCATKHAVVGLSTALRGEARAYGVGVSVICPGAVETELFDRIEYIRVDKDAVLRAVRRSMADPRACARRILDGVARDRAVITVNLHARAAWWAWRLAPGAFLAVARRGYQLLRSRLRTADKATDPTS